MNTSPQENAAGVPRIRLEGLVKRFGTKQVLRGIDLDIHPGESVVVIGPSGTGKSVTLRCILGLDTPDAGRIEVDGRKLDARGIAALRRRSGVLFQGGALFDSLPVWRNVAFRLLHDGMRQAKAREVATECLRLVDLDAGAGDLLPADLSGGMRKRVALARAIAASPEILFFDEPTAGLDPILATVVSQLIRRLVSEIGATAFTITQRSSERFHCRRPCRLAVRGEYSVVRLGCRAARERQRSCGAVHPRCGGGPDRDDALNRRLLDLEPMAVARS